MNKKYLTVAFTGLCLSGTIKAEEAKPNILVILADDLGYSDLSIQGCKQFQTPNIDSIAKNGVRFTEGYVSNSVCAPSRAGLLSGRIGIGFEANLPHGKGHGLDVNLKTMADVLKGAGYATSCIGKWHLGDEDKYYPTKRGFDYFCGLREGSRSYWYDPKKSDRPGSHKAIEENGKQIKFDGYVTDFLTDKAVQLISHQIEKKPDQPFFMYLSYTAPHGPMHGKPEIIEKFKNIKNEKRRIYAAMVTSLDEGIGRVIKTLRDKNVYENTVIVFLSDNGGPTQNASNNKPLKGTKGSLWEGGVRVPFFIQYMKEIPAGQVINEPIISLDLLPTFETIAGVKDRIKTSGIDLMPFLLGKGKKMDSRELVWRRGSKKQCALRSGKYKWLLNRYKNEQYLYDLKKDIGENKNLIKELPEIAQKIKKKFDHWETTVPDPAFKSGWKNRKKKKKLQKGEEK